MKIIPKSWADFQHYKDRAPPWIKLHKSLLDNFEFQCLPVASRALAPMLWLLASEQETGEIDATPKKLAFRLRMTEREVADALKPLIDNGFFSVTQDDSDALAECKRDAMPETEKRREEKEDRFEIFWKAYPRKVGKDAARKAFDKRKPDSNLLKQMLQAIAKQSESQAWMKDGGQYIPHPSTWLNEGRWQDGESSESPSAQFAGVI